MRLVSGWRRGCGTRGGDCCGWALSGRRGRGDATTAAAAWGAPKCSTIPHPFAPFRALRQNRVSKMRCFCVSESVALSVLRRRPLARCARPLLLNPFGARRSRSQVPAARLPIRPPLLPPRLPPRCTHATALTRSRRRCRRLLHLHHRKKLGLPILTEISRNQPHT